MPALGNLTEPTVRTDNPQFNITDGVHSQLTDVQVISNAQRKAASVLGTSDSLDILGDNGLQSQDSFGRWINDIIADSPGSLDDAVLESSISSGPDSFASVGIDQHQSSFSEHAFVITDFSPAWAYSSETTKVCFPSQVPLTFFIILWFLQWL